MRSRFPAPWIFLAVLLSAWALGCEANPTLIDYGVHGYVRSAQSGDAISGIDVTFTSDTLRRAADESDGDGRYEIVVESDTAFGHLTAVDPRGRYEAEIVEVYFDEQTRRVDIRMGPAPEPEG